MHLIDADALPRGNLAYREPALYDELTADTTLADDLVTLLAHHNPAARTVLDLGCGTARLLAELRAHGLTGTGIDIQPHLVAWARQARPEIRLDAADLRTARVDATFDLVVCIGNTLSYLRTDDELAAAFTTIAAHSHPRTLLALATLTGAGRDAHGSSEINTSLGAATVETTSAWDPPPASSPAPAPGASPTAGSSATPCAAAIGMSTCSRPSPGPPGSTSCRHLCRICRSARFAAGDG